MSADDSPRSTTGPAGRTRLAGVSGGIRFFATFFLANAGMYAVFQGMQQILLPSQIAAIDPDAKVAVYGLLASMGALAAAIGNPVFGSLSDRTRTRFGRRAPWLVISSFAALALLACLGLMRELFWLAAAYLAVMIAMSAFQAAISAVIPDRVAPNRRGLASSIAGASMTLGVMYGVNLAPHFLDAPTLGYVAIAALLVVGATTLVLFTRDPTAGADAETTPRERRRTGFFSGLRDHDFAWAFWARVTIMTGHWTISTYQLYTLTDYIGVENLPGGNAAAAVALLATVKLSLAFVTGLAAGPISDRIGRRKIFVVIASLGIAAGITVPIFVPTWTGMIVYTAMVGFFYGMFLAVDQAILTLVLPRAADTARDLGLLNVATTGPQIAGPFIAALVISFGGGYAPLFGFAAVLAALSALLILPLRGIR
ncbi:MFS transporter [Microbacterium sp. 2FI]|uniref:MFS transporter n=1 Tax=Microbacterium sp. 2FI TaxID=2502193 RepID=UPI0010F7C566|nr:MFS transporter [Microbacterium sp. 2FI]